MDRKRNRLILASASPRRKHLMRKAGYAFRVVVSHVKETVPRGMGPAQLVRHLAIKKASAVARVWPNHIVLAADTLVYINGHIVGKPRDAAHARRILSELSGAWQKVYTGVAVARGKSLPVRARVAVSRVKMRRLTPFDIERASKRHLDKAGAYAVQEKKDPFVERIVGDYDNVVGLPMRLVKKMLPVRS